MYGLNECIETETDLNKISDYDLHYTPSEIQVNCKNDIHLSNNDFPTKENVTSISSKAWNEQYSQRLANFMNNSKTLLENIEKKHNFINVQQNNSLNYSSEKYTHKASKSPTYTLIELEERLLQLDQCKNQENEKNEDINTRDFNYPSLKNYQNSSSEVKEVAVYDSQKNFSKKKHNFEEALRVDELESQLAQMKKLFDEKEKKVKLLQDELQSRKQIIKTPKEIIHRNAVSEFNNKNYLKKNEKIDQINAFDKFDHEIITNYSNNLSNSIFIAKDDTEQNLSIKDYNPNHPIVLQNKIKDLESQLQDLQEAYDIASQFPMTARNKSAIDSDIGSNTIISELVNRNEKLREEVELLRKMVPISKENSLASSTLREELENQKEELFLLKQKNKIIVNENIKLKTLLRKTGFSFDNDLFPKDNTDSLIGIDKELVSTHGTIFFEPTTMFQTNIRRMNNNCADDKINGEVSHNSADSISNEGENETQVEYQISNMIKSQKFQHSQICNNASLNEIPHVNGSKHEFSELNDFTLFDDQNIKTESVSDIYNKFSTIGKIAFAPRSGVDINVGNVIKFIRHGGRISKGLVHFIGHLPKRNDIYLGIELEIEDGKHDGLYEGKRYFQCRKNKGVFVAFNKIIMVYSQNR